jgi:hypothetical protein
MTDPSDANVIPMRDRRSARWLQYDGEQSIEDCIAKHPAFVNGEPVDSLPEATEPKARTLHLVRPETAEKGLEA